MDRGCQLSSIMVILLMLSLLLLADLPPPRPAASAGNDAGGGGGGDGNVRMERDDGEEKCMRPIPFHLKVPHTHSAFIKLDATQMRRGTSTHPLIDDQWYLQRVLQRVSGMGARSEVAGGSSNNSVRTGLGTGPREQPLTWDSMRNEIKSITPKQMNKVLDAAGKKQKEWDEIKEKLYKQGVMPCPDSPEGLRNSFNYPTNVDKVSQLATQASKENIAVKIAKKMLDIHESTDLATPSVDPSVICKNITELMKPPKCDPSASFRSMNGTCNNIHNPLWGAAFTSFRRNTPHNYGDNVFMLRLAKDGSPLLSPREISTNFYLPDNLQSSCFTILHMTFGQFVDHDLTATPHVTGKNGSDITCCDPRVLENPSLLHPECAAIPIPDNDPLYSAYGITCMDFVRSAPSPTCSMGKREQMNQITSYLDGSVVYGSSDEEAKFLRKGEHGLLSMQVTKENQELLPPNKDVSDGCNSPQHFKENRFCFIAGDHRANEQILLTLLQTVFARYHNFIARQLERLNPTWDDERLFQEARRIVVAVLQHITYREFLQGVLGTATMKSLGLMPQENGRHTNDYNDTLNAAIANEFAAAAYRFGHSMIPNQFLEETINRTFLPFNLNHGIFTPFSLYNSEKLGNLMRGASKQKANVVDSSFTNEVVGKLFQRNLTFGLDLVALNIQRGRDHGLGTYVASRKACGYGETKDFDDLASTIQPSLLNRLRHLYKHVSDIDLFVGLLAEIPLNGAQVGPTLACILGDQFLRLKKGDRFWFEYKGSPGAFTTAQLREIHKVSLARVMCDTVLELKAVQRWPLNVESAYNPELPCDSQCIPSLNISHWKE